MCVNILKKPNCLFLFGCSVLMLLLPIKAIETTITTTNYPTTTTATTTETAITPQTFKFTAANVLRVTDLPKDGPIKRNVKLKDLSEAGSAAATAKSYDPPPEYYRGPGSASNTSPNTAASGANSYNNRNTANTIKPFSFPDNNARNKYNADSSVQLANEYKTWQLLRGKQPAYNNNNNRNYNNIKDRISVGHYGSSAHGHNDYGYEQHPAYLDAPHHDYGYYADTGHGAGYYGAGTNNEGIHFDLYGSKGHIPHGHGTTHASAGHYAGAGGEYSYTYPELHEHSAAPSYNSKEQSEHKALLAKSFLIPLASAAVLGIAAALVSNPLLLQLGTVSGGVGVGPTIVGKRKRRDLSQQLPAALSERRTIRGNKLAYRGYRSESGLRGV